MYILKFTEIDAWLYKVCINLYTFAADIYAFIIKLAGTEIMDSNTIKTYAGSISVLVGVFMLFRVAITLLSYLVDPEAIDDKKVGSSSLITGIVITMAMLLTYQLAFKALRTIQQAILNPKDGSNILVQLFSGNVGVKEKEYINGANCYYSNGQLSGGESYDIMISLVNNSLETTIYTRGNVVQALGITYDKAASYMIVYDKYKQDVSDKWYKANTITQVNFDNDNLTSITGTSASDVVIHSCPQYVSVERSSIFGYHATLSDSSSGGSTVAALDNSKTTKKAYQNDSGRIMAGSLLFSFISCSGNDCDGFAQHVSENNIEKTYDDVIEKDLLGAYKFKDGVNFKGFLALIFGIVLILFLVTSTADVAVRAVKLIVLEIFAPIPIIAYSDPKLRNTFDSWIKIVGATYVDIFIRIIIISVCNFLIANIKIQTFENSIRIVFIIGILLFIKEAPQFVCDALGIKAKGLGNFTLNPVDKLKQVPVVGSAVNAASSGATQGWATLRSGQGIGKTITATASGAGEGWRKNGGMMATGKEVAPGFTTRTRQATKQAIKGEQEKNRQASRDMALFTTADQVNGQTHTAKQYADLGKGNTIYKAAPQGGHTVHDHLEHIENNTTPPLP